MPRLRCPLMIAALAALALVPAAAAAPPEGPAICSSPGRPISGSYGGLTVHGNAYVEAGATLAVKRTLTIAPGACLDAFTTATVTVGGDVVVRGGAILALGCSPGAIGLTPPCGSTVTHDSVGGNIVGRAPLTMYLTALRVGGSVISSGGGPGASRHPYVNFAIKENRIGGELRVSGWRGTWLGLLRNTVRRNTVLTGNAAADPDAVELAGNTFLGDLQCTGNSPAPKLGDSKGTLSTVAGRALGQCAGVARHVARPR